MSAELLAGTLAIVLSLLFSYIPGLKDAFGGLTKGQKQLVMGLGLCVVAVSAFGLSCAGLVDIGLSCDQDSAMGLVSTLIAALVANQSIYGLTKK